MQRNRLKLRLIARGRKSVSESEIKGFIAQRNEPVHLREIIDHFMDRYSSAESARVSISNKLRTLVRKGDVVLLPDGRYAVRKFWSTPKGALLFSLLWIDVFLVGLTLLLFYALQMMAIVYIMLYAMAVIDIMVFVMAKFMGGGS